MMKLRWCRLPLVRGFLPAVVLLLAVVPLTRSQTIATTNWTGGASGSWFAPGNWSLGTAPNNGNPSNTEYLVNIAAPVGAAVTIGPVSPPLNSFNPTIDGFALTASGGSLTIASGFQLTVLGTNGGRFTNNGTVFVNGFLVTGANLGSLTFTLTGAGTLMLSGGVVNGFGSALTSAITINGAGTVSNNGNFGFTNQAGGLVDANVSGQTFALTAGNATGNAFANAGTLQAPNAGTLSASSFQALTNTGTIVARSGSTVSLLGTGLSNLSGSTLTGGTYQAFGPGGIIQLANNANVTALGNGTTVIMDNGGKITDQNGLNAFRNLSTVGAGGSFQIANGNNFTATAAFSNAGTVMVSNATTLSVPTSYTQTGGVTQLTDAGSVLTVTGTSPTATFSGETLKGNGVVNANVNNSGGTIALGNSPGLLTVNGNLTMGSGSAFQAEIGGATQGAQYDFLSVSGGATLGSTLQVSLVSGFQPASASQTFTILSATGPLSGSFANVPSGGTLTTLDGGGIFRVFYGAGSPNGANNVVLAGFSPVPEPPACLFIASLGLVGTGFARRRGKMQNAALQPPAQCGTRA